ncbi:ABC transporter permease [Puia sp.]|uniref:ABC transporter permease n=1 Tax=Puia sp. TaxID=2045100 RepID=UPI002F427629
MFKNFFTVALRSMTRSKVYTAINIFGLSTGMAVALLIGLWVHDELTFNQSFPNYSRIGNVMRDIGINGTRSAYGGAPYEMEAELRTHYGRYFKHIAYATYPDNNVLIVNGKSFRVNGQFMGEEMPQILSLHLLQGSPNGLHDPSSIFLSASTAKALFGSADPLGKTVKLDSGQLVQVTGVYADLPYNSDFKDLAFIAPSDLYYAMHPPSANVGNHWRFYNLFDVYVQLADGVDWKTVDEKIRLLRRDKMDLATFNADRSYQFVYPMSRWHLYDPLQLPGTRNKIQYVWLLGLIGVFVLLLACINFMNLSTARSEKRAKEVGIRKTIGSLRSQIILQFFGESLFAVGCSLVFCILFTQLLLPVFNDLTDKKLSLLWLNAGFWGIMLLFGLLTGIIAGCYPALSPSPKPPVWRNIFKTSARTLKQKISSRMPPSW